jgi:ornithine lipid ester-linked acyl 2-hydroxylase
MQGLMKRRMSVRLVVKAATLTFDRVLYRPTQWLVRRFSSVGRHQFFDRSQFAWIPPIEARWTEIRDEVRALLRERERIPNFENIAPGNTPGALRDGKWRSYWLYAYGRKTGDNCRCCPETTRLIDTIPRMKTAFFSILAPGKHIPEHTGPYAGVLRYHLGLIVPRQKEACRIRVGSDVAHWEAGRSLVFDDTYPHEVWNDTDEERVVLFVDFARPLPFPLSVLNEAVIRLASRSAFVQDIVENVDEWNRQTSAGSPNGREAARPPPA